MKRMIQRLVIAISCARSCDCRVLGKLLDQLLPFGQEYVSALLVSKAIYHHWEYVSFFQGTKKQLDDYMFANDSCESRPARRS